ncbi:MAG: CBS domain-containing protein [Nitrososphaerota archaeon]|nr:CBS domain-containing protein [Candidatus Bathyarchaeota archaeon]MDW8022169.1 CBS domain-containing protein [Nitrososphaerota archaeon]
MSEKKSENTLSLKVEDVMVREVVTIDENSTIKEAAEIMNKFEIGCLIAVKKGKAVGIITERDMLKRVVAETRDVKKRRLRMLCQAP